MTASYCHPAGKAANVQTAESEFAVFQREGLVPLGKSSAVRDGCARIMDALADEAQPLMVAKRCVGLIRALSAKPKASQSEIYDTDQRALLASPRCATLPAGQSAGANGRRLGRATDDLGPSSGLWGRIW